MNIPRVYLIVCTFCALGGQVPAAEPDRAARFFDQVKPLLDAKCVQCHGPDKQKGKLRLDTLDAAKKGGATGPAIVPGDPDKSLLVQAIRHARADVQMPPKEKLKDAQIALLADWIKDGAFWPDKDTRAIAKVSGPIGDAWNDANNPIRKIFKGERLDLWSLQKPVRPEVPAVKNTPWARTPIDSFLLARMDAKGLTPSPEADRRTLVRRLSFDLIGLPPTPEEMDALLRDQSVDWYEKLVDKLLASPRYGERWARHWLDVVRYADTNGFERDEYRPLIWQYRDYVIRSFNQDKPYDQFVREQLAGDELVAGPPRTLAEADALIATGYLRLGLFDSTATLFQAEKKAHDELMADLVNTTGAAFLGLTFACCQCHDHKHDPLSQADHYRLRAFFAGVKFRDDLVVDPADVLDEIARHNAAIDTRHGTLQAELNGLLAPAREQFVEQRRAKFPPEIIELLKIEEAKRDEATKKKLQPFLAQLQVNDKDAAAALGEAEKKRHAELAQQVRELAGRKRSPTRAMGMTDVGPSAPATHIFYQGDCTQPREEVRPGFPSVWHASPAVVRAPSKNTTGRRLALADWIAARDNPWTARVLVNRLWQHHFGRGLVATPGDFGYAGTKPTHPDLLDWLACEFMANGGRESPEWSIKKMHRLIVRSAAYRQRSVDDPKRRALDPENSLLWRQNAQRLNAETLRDGLLFVSGLLQPVDGGKPLWPPVPEDLLKAQPGILEAEKGGDAGRMQGWYADPLEKTDVRSIFLIQKRSLPIPFLQAFDLPDPTVSCSRRQVTVVAPQALTLLNSPEAVRYARAFAKRIADEAGPEPARRVEQALLRALGRTPDAEEKKLSLDLLERHTAAHRKAGKPNGPAPELLALVDLCRALLNLNEFLYID